MAAGFVLNLEEKAEHNEHFREVLYTAPHSQLVVMSLAPNEEIGMEVHEHVDQFLRVEEGRGKAVLNGEEFALEEGFAVVVPAGVQHNIVNTSTTEPFKLYTIYSPGHHRDGVVHHTKADALADTTDEL